MTARDYEWTTAAGHAGAGAALRKVRTSCARHSQATTIPFLSRSRVGDVPGLIVRDAFDRMLVYCQRHSAVLVGEYSCCQKGHEVADADGRVTRILCDKIAVRKVLTDLLDHSLGKLREATLRNPEFDRTSAVWDAVRRDRSFSFTSFMLLSWMKSILQAESADEQDWLALGWSLPVEEIGEAELARYWEERCLGWPQPPSAMLVPALEGTCRCFAILSSAWATVRLVTIRSAAQRRCKQQHAAAMLAWCGTCANAQKLM
jgi:hypothetical protein